MLLRGPLSWGFETPTLRCGPLSCGVGLPRFCEVPACDFCPLHLGPYGPMSMPAGR